MRKYLFKCGAQSLLGPTQSGLPDISSSPIIICTQVYHIYDMQDNHIFFSLFLRREIIFKCNKNPQAVFFFFFFIIPATAYAPWAHFAVFTFQREGVTEIGCQGEINTAKKSRESLFSLSHVLRVVLQTVGLICPLLSIYPTLHNSSCHCGLFLTQHSVTAYSQV